VCRAAPEALQLCDEENTAPNDFGLKRSQARLGGFHLSRASHVHIITMNAILALLLDLLIAAVGIDLIIVGCVIVVLRAAAAAKRFRVARRLPCRRTNTSSTAEGGGRRCGGGVGGAAGQDGLDVTRFIQLLQGDMDR
jgi:hypothetical protein